jgi:GrpB-like predicted nucleotidyltransferase (UPF0157 family)
MNEPGPEYINGPIEIVAYDPNWPHQFEAEAQCIRNALRHKAISIEHVGSTAVPGLAAKPVIDINLAVLNSADEEDYAPQLERAGYRLYIREPDWFEHRLFKRSDLRVNLHVFSEGCSELDRMLWFRNWLRVNTEDRDLYAQTKKQLGQRHWQRVQDYADAKQEVIAAIFRRAKIA